MAYYCFTVVKEKFACRGKNTKQSIAKALNISEAVVDHISRLSSWVGTRKADACRPHTEAEKSWLAGATRILIRRLGEYEAGKSPLTQITLSDLPALK